MSNPSEKSYALDEVLRQEAEFRARTVREFAILDEANRKLRERVEEQQSKMGEKDTYIHGLHLELENLRADSLERQRERETYIHELHLKIEEMRKTGLEEMRRRDTVFHELNLKHQALQAEATEEKRRSETAIHALNLQVQDLTEKLNSGLAERDAEIDRANRRMLAAQKDNDGARGDAGWFATTLGATEERLRARDWRLRWIESSLTWKLFGWLVGLERGISPLPRTASDLLPGRGDSYHLSPSPFRIHRSDTFEFSGWVKASDGAPVKAVRVRLAGTESAPIAQPALADSPEGAVTFEFKLGIPPGRHWLRLECQGADGAWRSVLNTLSVRETSPVT